MTDINTPISLYDDMAELWALPEALMGGTRAMRQAGVKYLPKEGAYAENANGTVDTTKWVGESEQAYQRRLARTVLYNAYKKAVHGLRGKVFSKPVMLDSSAPERFKDWIDDVDLMGRDLTAFSYDVLEAALTYGISYIMPDYARLPEGATRADAKRLNARPYLIHVHPRNVIGWRFNDATGKRTLEQVRIREYGVIPDGDYDIQNIVRVRVLFRDRWELWQAKANENNGPLNANRLLANQSAIDTGGFEQVDEGPNRLGEVLLVPVYTGRVGDMQAEPPLMDLAYKNLEHWQSSSDQRHILHVARVPLLFGRGISGHDQLEIGPNRMVTTSSENADLKYVEHNGNSINAGREDLQNIEAQMRALAMEPMLPRPGDMTATSKAIDKAEADSNLKAWALNLQDSLEQALFLMDRLAGGNEGAAVSVNTEFGLSLDEIEDLKLLTTLRTTGDLSQETLWSEFQRRGSLSDDFDTDEERERLAMEEPRVSAMPFIDPMMQDQQTPPDEQTTQTEPPVTEPA